MIKLLHLADLHIGMENYGRLDPATGMHTRLIDYLDRLDEAIEYGLAEGADAVLIAGDVYKNRRPTPLTSASSPAAFCVCAAPVCRSSSWSAITMSRRQLAARTRSRSSIRWH